MSNQRISNRARKQSKQCVALHIIVKNIYIYIHILDTTQHNSYIFLKHYARIFSLVGDKLNNEHLLAYASGGQGPNPNICS